MKTVALKIVYKHLWGFRVSYPYQSSAQATHIYPPPSTLVGALAYPFFINLGLPEAIKDPEIISATYILAKNTVSVHFSYIIDDRFIPSRYGDISRLSIISYLDHKYRKNEKFWFAIQSMEKIYYKGRAKVVYLIDTESLAEDLGKREIHKYLKSAAFSISRVGSKESITSVERVFISRCKLTEPPHKVYTRYYFPIPNGLPQTETDNYIITAYWDYREKYPYIYRYRGEPIFTKEVEYLIPVDPWLKLYSDYIYVYEPDDHYVFDVDGESLLVPKRWISK